MKPLRLVPPTTEVAASGRKPHYCRIPIQRFRKKSLRRRGWIWCGQIWAIEKKIAGRSVVGIIEEEHLDHVICKFMLLDDLWAEAMHYRRNQEAVKRRRAFEVVDRFGRRKARRFVSCLTVVVNPKNGVPTK